MTHYNFSAIIVVDSAVIAAGLSSIIHSLNNFTVSKLIDSKAGLIKYADTTAIAPDLVIADIDVLVKNEYTCLGLLRDKWPQLAILAISAQEVKPEEIAILEENRVDYLSILSSDENLKHYLEQFAAHNTPHSKLAGKTIQLTNKEREFIGLICSNLTYKEIAGIMGISKRTVDTHRDHLFDKFSINSRSALISHAIRLGLINAQ